jgi:hypothetical protein
MNEDLKTKLQKKIAEAQGRRTGTTLRSARSMVSKQERNKLSKEVRKKGVKALAEKLGVTDPKTMDLIRDMIKTGEVKSVEELTKRLGEVKAQEAMHEEAKELAAQGPPPELEDNTMEQMTIPSLPGNHPQRKTLKPPVVPKSIQTWLQTGV